MSGKVASIVDIDKDWYWCIPVGLIEMGDALLLLSRWTYNLQLPTWNIFANARISFPSSMATTMWWTLMPFMWLWCDLDILRSGIALYRQIRLRKSSSPGLLSGFKLGVWWQMAKHGETKRDAICVVSHGVRITLEESVTDTVEAQLRKCEHTAFGRGRSGCPCPQWFEIQKMMSLQVDPHPRILLRIVMPWGGWCLMKDSDSGQQTLMIWMGWFNSRMMLIWDLGWCKSESASSGLDTKMMCFASETWIQMTKCQPESMNQIYPSQQSKCLGVFSKTHFSRISRAKEFSKENQNLLFLVTAPWTWNMTLPFSFSNENRLLTRVFHAPWGSWRSCGLALGLLPLDSWMGLYEWGTAMRNGWTFSERGFQVRWGRCGGACRELFWFFWPLWIWNKQLYIRGFKVRKFFKQQSTVIYFLQGKVQFVSCLTSLLMTRPLRSSSTQWTQMSHDEP